MDDVPDCIQEVESNIDSLSSSLDEISSKLQGSLKLETDQEVLSPIVFRGNCK